MGKRARNQTPRKSRIVVNDVPPSPLSDEERTLAPITPAPIITAPITPAPTTTFYRSRPQRLTDAATRENHRFVGTMMDYEPFRANPDKPKAPLGKFTIEFRNEEGVMLWNECTVFTHEKAKYAKHLPMRVGFTMVPHHKNPRTKVIGKFWPLVEEE